MQNSSNGMSPEYTESVAARRLQEQLDSTTATIGIIGLGYVGLPLAVEYAAQGFQTLGFDLDAERVARLNRGANYNADLDDAQVARLAEAGRLAATTDMERMGEADVLFICVPTPLTDHKDPDTSYIEAATRAVAARLRPGQLVVLKSTTYPGTTDTLVRPLLEQAAAERDMTLGTDYFLAFSPERIDPGNKEYTTANTPVVAGGVTEACGALAEQALQAIVGEVHLVSGPKPAEMEKLLENIFRSVNIALVNELARLCDRMGDVSMWEVVEAAATKPFGFMPFYPGPGLGGHCIPVDPHYLGWLARKYDFETSFITLAARVNEEMPVHVTNAVVKAIAAQPVALAEAKVLVLGVAFKRDVDDTRHSPAEAVIRHLKEEGVGQVAFADPHVGAFAVRTKRNGTVEVPRVELTQETLEAHDVAVIVTDHARFDYELIARHAPAIVDTRNALDGVDVNPEKLYLLGAPAEQGVPAPHTPSVT